MSSKRGLGLQSKEFTTLHVRQSLEFSYSQAIDSFLSSYGEVGVDKNLLNEMREDIYTNLLALYDKHGPRFLEPTYYKIEPRVMLPIVQRYLGTQFTFIEEARQKLLVAKELAKIPLEDESPEAVIDRMYFEAIDFFLENEIRPLLMANNGGYRRNPGEDLQKIRALIYTTLTNSYLEGQIHEMDYPNFPPDITETLHACARQVLGDKFDTMFATRRAIEAAYMARPDQPLS